MNPEKIQEIRNMLTIPNKWYHKIPYIGKKIHSKQQYKRFQKHKSDLNHIIVEEADKSAKEDLENYFEQFADIRDIDLGDSAKYTLSENISFDSSYKNLRHLDLIRKCNEIKELVK